MLTIQTLQTIRRFSVTASFALFALSVSAQKTEKIFFTDKWEKTTQAKATYYRLVTLDKSGKPVGKVKDYWMTGELHWEGEHLNYNASDPDRSLKTGLCTSYHKNGEKSTETNYVNGKKHGMSKTWNAWGYLSSEINYSMDEFDGPHTLYDMFGKVYLSYHYKKGALHGLQKQWLADEKLMLHVQYNNGKREGYWHEAWQSADDKRFRVFMDDFTDPANPNNWTLPQLPSASAEMNDKLVLKTKDNVALSSLSTVSLITDKEFIVAASFTLQDGDPSAGHGIIWNFRNWQNYCFATLHRNNVFRLGRVVNGKKQIGEGKVEIREGINKVSMVKQGSLISFFANGKEFAAGINMRTLEGDRLYDSDLLEGQGKLGVLVHGGRTQANFEMFSVFMEKPTK